MKNALAIAKIIGTHGVLGTLKVLPYTRSEAFFQPEQNVRLADGKGFCGDFKVKWFKPRNKGGMLLAIERITDIDSASELVGLEIFIDREDLPAPEPGEYYWADLIGLSVQTVSGEHIGCIDAMFVTGSNDVCVVKDGSRETLVPFIEKVVKAIDFERKTMLVVLPEGLP
jgi:16S rRNA processing protein RimM